MPFRSALELTVISYTPTPPLAQQRQGGIPWICILLETDSAHKSHIARVDQYRRMCLPSSLLEASQETGSTAQVTLLSVSPLIIQVDGFLTPAMCGAVVQLAKPRLVRSMVSKGVDSMR